eukprot:jgi/Galph1/5937/GphlegSOOS_G4625.1
MRNFSFVACCACRKECTKSRYFKRNQTLSRRTQWIQRFRHFSPLPVLFQCFAQQESDANDFPAETLVPSPLHSSDSDGSYPRDYLNNSSTSDLDKEYQENSFSSRCSVQLQVLRRVSRWIGPNDYDNLIWSLAIPSYASLLLDPLCALVDTAFVGRLGVAPLGGVGVSNSVFSYCSFIFVFLIASTNSSVAAALVKKNNDEVSISVAQNIWVAFFLGIITGALVAYFAPLLVSLMGATPEVLPHAVDYLRMRAISAPAILMFFVMAGAFRGYQDLKPTLYASVLSNLLNIVLDPLMIFTWNGGTAGAALATSVSQIVATAMLIFLSVTKKHLNLKHLFHLPSFSQFWNILKPGGALTIRKILENISYTCATSMAARLGATEAACMEICKQVWWISGISWWPLNIVAQSLVAKEEALGNWVQVRNISFRILQFGSFFGVLVGILGILLKGWIPAVFTSDPTVYASLRVLLPILSVVLPISACLDILEGIFIAWRDYSFIAKTMLLATTIFLYILYLTQRYKMGMIGIWLAIGILLFIR